MKKNTVKVIIALLFLAIFSLPKIYGYLINTNSYSNVFKFANRYTVDRYYYYIDESDNRVTAKANTSERVFDGTSVNVGGTLMNLDYSKVEYFVNNNLYTNSTYTVHSNTLIDEVYTLNRYTITYDLDGGTLNDPKTTYTSMTSTFDLPTPTKGSETFKGWCVGNDCSLPYTVTQGSTGNISVKAKWAQTFAVQYRGNNYTHNGPATIGEGETFTATFQLNGAAYFTGVTITMNNRTLREGTGYTLSGSGSTRTLTVPNVDGPIDINVQTGNWCLPEGTLIMLWDGSYKKIEDITYNDLLRVWNHDTGSYGYEYPAWIEKAGNSDVYTKVTFSDGSELKVVGNHSIFSKTRNKYVDINSDEFNVGDKVVNLKNGLSYVTVTKIEVIEKSIKYYHVISSRYFNLITNNVLTTYEIYNNISNFMGFDGNLKWQIADIVRQDLYTYEDFSYLDHYLFKVFRLGELKYLVKNNMITQEEMNDLFNNYLMDNDKKVIPQRNSAGNYLWMVTTSDDVNPSDKSHQMVEGSTYKVPTPKKTNGFKYWYNHSDNKYYQPGDTIKVDSSMYLEAIYK